MYSVQMHVFFLNVFNLWVVESTDKELWDAEG